MTSPGQADYDGVEIRRLGEVYLFRLIDLADFRVTDSEIIAYAYNADEIIFAEKELFDTILPLYLELNGYLVLHASAIALGSKAYVFTAYSGRGKSSLAGGLVQRGGQFIADDRVVIDTRSDPYLVLPGYPVLRLWADAAAYFPDLPTYPIMHPDWRKHLVSLESWGQMQTTPCPLGGIFLVDCNPDYDDIHFTPLHGHAGIFRLLHSSSIYTAVIDVQAHRLQLITSLTAQIPVKIFSYPAAYARLPESLDALLAEINTR